MFQEFALVPIVAAALGVVLGCSSAGTSTNGGTGGEGGAPSDTGGVEASAGVGPVECDCDDGFSCTVDRCVGNECVHSIGPNEGETACPSAQYCTLEDGCVDSPACADDLDCEDFFDGDA